MVKMQSALMKLREVVSEKREKMLFLIVLLYVVFYRTINEVTTMQNFNVDWWEVILWLVLGLAPVALFAFIALTAYMKKVKWAGYFFVFTFMIMTRARFVPWFLNIGSETRVLPVVSIVLGSVIFLYLTAMVVLSLQEALDKTKSEPIPYLFWVLVAGIFTLYALNGLTLALYLVILSAFIYYKGYAMIAYTVIIFAGTLAIFARFQQWLLFGTGFMQTMQWINLSVAVALVALAVYGYMLLNQHMSVKDVIGWVMHGVKEPSDKPEKKIRPTPKKPEETNIETPVQ